MATRIVVPLDLLVAQASVSEATGDDELDWSFDDAELTRQLRAVKSGRGVSIALLVGSALALATAMLLFT